MKKVKCIHCGIEIPTGRLNALPNTKTCTEHSNVDKLYANPIIRNDEDYSELEFIKDPNVIAELQRMRTITSGHIAHKPE